jgi:integrase
MFTKPLHRGDFCATFRSCPFASVRLNPAPMLGQMLGQKLGRDYRGQCHEGTKRVAIVPQACGDSATSVWRECHKRVARVQRAGSETTLRDDLEAEAKGRKDERPMRKINRLTARAVNTLTKPGRHPDGGNLYLSISDNGGRRWVFLYRWHGRSIEIGLGSARDVSLPRARELALAARTKLAAGIDPKESREPTKDATFADVAAEVIASMRPSWRNAIHAAQWEKTLTDYAAPLRHLPVDKISTEDVLAVLKPRWIATPTTASRLRGRIERVLDAAKARGLRTGENPARWRGHLDQLLPRRPRLAQRRHAAMSYSEVPDFMARLRAVDTVVARALEFTILTVARSGEVLGARWEEVDLERAVWTVPAERMKGGREHRVPLVGRALEILLALHAARTGDFVFPGSRPGRALRNMKHVMQRRMGLKVSVHGFRSSFRDWAAECTSFTNEVCEAAMAHAIENRTEAAYRRGDLFAKRRMLMQAWDRSCATPSGGRVVAFGA